MDEPSKMDSLKGLLCDKFGVACTKPPESAPVVAIAPAPSACEKLGAEIEANGGSVRAGQQRMAISCGLGGT